MSNIRLPRVPKVTISLRVKEIAEEKGVSIADLSFGTQISRQQIYNIWNNNVKGVNFDTLGKIAYVLNVSVKDLFAEGEITIDDCVVESEENKNP